MNQARLARVLRNMERDGLTQIVISSTASVYYLTGYWVEPMERMLALYIRADGTCQLFANALFALEPQEGLELVLHQDSDVPTAALAAALLPGTLGVDKAWPSKFLIALLAARPDVTPVLGSAPVDDARKYKDADEISAMRRASQINDQVVEAAIAAVRAGAVESELAAYVEGLYRQHGADRSGEGQLVCFGPNGADPHYAPNGTVLRDGDSVVLDIFIPIRRYWCDMTRTVFFRSVSDEGRRVYETVKAANLAAEAVIRPGVPMKDIDRAARKLIEDAGYGPSSPTGWATAAAWTATSRRTTAPPAPPSPNRGWSSPWSRASTCPASWACVLEDLVLVTEDGCEVLNHASKELRVVD